MLLGFQTQPLQQVNCWIQSPLCVTTSAYITCNFPAGCVIDEKTDYRGHDIKMIKNVENHEACAKLAAANKKAKFWTYQAASKNCFIKTSKKGKKPNKTVVSGNQECGV